MIREAIEFVTERAVLATGLQVLDLPLEPDHVYATYDRSTGDFSQRTVEPNPKNYEVFSIDDFVGLVQHERAEADVAHAPGAVFCGVGTISWRHKASERRDGVRLAFRPSPEYKTLAELANNRQALSHEKFIKLLRVDLGNVCDADTLAQFRQLRFERNKSVEADRQFAAESLESKVVSAVHANGKGVPESVRFDIQVFDGPDEMFQRSIQCVLDVDFADCTIVIIPVAGELTRAVYEVDTAIQARLIEAFADDRAIRVVRGRECFGA